MAEQPSSDVRSSGISMDDILYFLKKIISIANFAEQILNAMPSVNTTLAELELKENEMKNQAKENPEEDLEARLAVSSRLASQFGDCTRKAQSYMTACLKIADRLNEETLQNLQDDFCTRKLRELINRIDKDLDCCTEKRDEFKKSLKQVREEASDTRKEFQENSGSWKWYTPATILQANRGLLYMLIVAVVIVTVVLLSKFKFLDCDYYTLSIILGVLIGLFTISYLAQFPLGIWVKKAEDRHKNRLERRASCNKVLELIVEKVEELNKLEVCLDEVDHMQQADFLKEHMEDGLKDIEEEDIPNKVKEQIISCLRKFQEITQDIKKYVDSRHMRESSHDPADNSAIRQAITPNSSEQNLPAHQPENNDGTSTTVSNPPSRPAALKNRAGVQKQDSKVETVGPMGSTREEDSGIAP